MKDPAGRDAEVKRPRPVPVAVERRRRELVCVWPDPGENKTVSDLESKKETYTSVMWTYGAGGPWVRRFWHDEAGFEAHAHAQAGPHSTRGR